LIVKAEAAKLDPQNLPDIEGEGLMRAKAAELLRIQEPQETN
jgi:hypothetical protein